MPWPVWILVGAVALFMIDRALLAAEERGWIYWRRRKPSRAQMGTALQNIQALLEPEREHIVEQRSHEQADIDVAGDDEPEDPSGGDGQPDQPTRSG